MTQSYLTDSSRLSSSEKQEILDLLEQSKFFEISPKLPPSAEEQKGAADYFDYEIVVERDDGKVFTVYRNDFTIDPSLRSLIELIKNKQ